MKKDFDDEPAKWLPYPQYKPTEVGDYLVTLKSHLTGSIFTSTATWHEKKGWALTRYTVTAWMYVPAPYMSYRKEMEKEKMEKEK